MNLTQRQDGSWAALNNDLLVQSRPLLDSIYMAELAKEFTRDQLQADWTAQSKDIGIDFQNNLHASRERAKDLVSLARHSPEPEARQRIADTALIWAIKHLAERETVMSQSELLSHALRHGEGAVSAEQLRLSLSRLVA